MYLSLMNVKSKEYILFVDHRTSNIKYDYFTSKKNDIITIYIYIYITIIPLILA